MHLISQLKKHNIIKTGIFTLKSGETSNIYFDFKSVISYPNLMANISYELSKLVSTIGMLCGVPQGGIPYACNISQINNMPMILLRDEKKEYGTQKQVEGELFDKKVILIEDVITTGASVLNAIGLLEKNGLKVKQVICILDREAGGVNILKDSGYRVSSLLTMTDCLKYVEPIQTIKIKNQITKKLFNLINMKKTNLVVSLDMDNTETLFSILDLIGDHICAVKIHFDVFISLHEDFLAKLNEIKLKKNFMVIEDRKFADIPFISLKQLDFVQEFADIVTVHGICGESLIKEMNKRNVGLLPVHMMSVEGNLIDSTYSNKMLDICKRYNNVVGFVSQKKIDNYLTFSPGIKLNKGTDNMGQKYNSVVDSDADIFIVGRGIYESANVLEETVAYKKECFSKWKY